MGIVKDREASLQYINILFCCEEVLTVNFIWGMMVVRGQHLCVPFYLYIRLWSSSC